MNSQKLPKGTISVNEAKQLENLYKTEFYEDINEIMAQKYPSYDGAVRDVWFSLSELKAYIKQVESYAKDKGYSDLGMRIYFGAEEKMGQDGMLYPRQTVFFVPTCSDTPSGIVNKSNMLGVDRLNFGTGGIPDSVDSDSGIL